MPLSTVCEEREFNFLAVRLMLDVLSKYSYSLYIGTLQVRHWSVAYYRWQFPIWRERFKYQLTGPSLQNKLAYQGKSLLWRGSVTCLFHMKKSQLVQSCLVKISYLYDWICLLKAGLFDL